MVQSKFKRRQFDWVMAQKFNVETSSRRISGVRVSTVGLELTTLTEGTGQVWKEAALLQTADAWGATGWSWVFGSPASGRSVHSWTRPYLNNKPLNKVWSKLYLKEFYLNNSCNLNNSCKAFYPITNRGFDQPFSKRLKCCRGGPVWYGVGLLIPWSFGSRGFKSRPRRL